MLGLLTAMIAGTCFAFFLLSIICILAVVCAIFYKKENKTALLTGLLCVCAGILSYSVAYYINVVPVESLANQSGRLTAEVTEQTITNGTYTYCLKTNKISLNDKSIQSVPQNIKFRIVTRYDLGIEQYDNVIMDVIFSSKSNSPYTCHDISNGYFINVSLADSNVVVCSKQAVPWYGCITNIKDAIKDKTKTLLDSNQSSLLATLLLGDKSEMSSNLRESFRSAGLSHILVVSGLHLTIIVNFIFGLLSFFIKNKKIPAGITIAFILLYAILTGCSYSIMRSSIMSIIYLLSFFFLKNTSSLNNLGAAGIIITIQNPLAIGNLGLLMSFGATLGICTLGNKMNTFLISKLPKVKEAALHKAIYYVVSYFINTSSVSVSATLFTLPVMVFVFEQFNIYFLISNLLITFAAPLVIVVGIIMLMLSCLPFANILTQLVAIAEGLLCNYILGISSFVSNLPFATIELSDNFVKLAMIAVFTVVTVFFVVQGFRIKSIGSCTIVSTSMAVMILMSKYAIMTQAVYFEVIKTGNGVTITEHGNGGTSLICCGGTNYYFDNVLNSVEGNKINTVIIPDSYSYYSQYAEEIFLEFNVNNVFIYEDTGYSDELKEILAEQNYEFIDENTDINCGSYCVSIIPTKDKRWIYITIDNSSILVAPQKGDFALLPQKYLTNSITILEKDCINIELLNCENTVFCGKNDNSEYCTGNGSVSLFKFADRSINLWQK